MANRQLSQIQKNLLRNYLANRNQKVTLRSQLTKGGPRLWVTPIAILTIGGLLVSSASYRCVGIFLVAYVIGMLHYHFRRLMAYSEVWPVLERVLNWGKVEALAEDKEE